MAIRTQTQIRTLGLGSPAQLMAGRWNTAVFHLLAGSGAITVIVGSHMAWATFYAGLIERNGMPGHGKYFVGLAAASLAALALSAAPGVSRALRWFPLAAGATIAVFAYRDLRNLNALVNDPAAGFYVPGRGDGLYVVIAGAALLALAIFARADMPRLRPLSLMPTLAAIFAVAGIAALIPGLYGEYYLHLSNGHARDHTDTLQSAHVLTAGGVLVLLAAARLAFTTAIRNRRRCKRGDETLNATS